MRQRLGTLAEPYRRGNAAHLIKTAEALTAAGALAGLVFARHRTVAAAAGAALLAGSALTRFAVFEAGRASAADPKYTILHQRGKDHA
jgi:hypothetical protein